MTTAYKVLGQSIPVATTNTVLYTVPAATSTVTSTLTACNQGAATTIRVAVQPAGAAIASQHYILYDVDLLAKDTLFFTIGVTLASTDVISVYAGTSTVSFNLFGSEIS